MKPALIELQDVDNALARLEREMAHLDDGSTARAERDRLKSELTAQTERNRHLNGERSDQELKLKTAEEKLTRQKARVMSATSAHEISALERDIQGLEKARGDLDDSILNLMEACEQSAQSLEILERQLEAAVAEVNTVTGTLASESTRIQTERKKRHAQRLELEDKLSPAEKARYEAAAKAHKGIAVARVVNGNCSACGAEILPFTLKEARATEYPTCENCGRYIYLP